MCYLPPFQNWIELVCNLSQCGATECDALTNQPPNQIMSVKDSATRALLSWSQAWVEQFLFLCLYYLFDPQIKTFILKALLIPFSLFLFQISIL